MYLLPLGNKIHAYPYKACFFMQLLRCGKEQAFYVR